MDSDMTGGGGGGGDEQDQAERLDDSEILTDEDVQGLNDDAMDDYPPDELQGADEYGTTPQEERIDEPLDERERRYEPDPAAELVPDPGLDPHDPRRRLLRREERLTGEVDDLDELEDLDLLDPVAGEPEEVPVDPMVLESLGDEEHPVEPGEELEAEVATVVEAYDSEDPPEPDLLDDGRSG
ncbi:MAG: hypothetical protein R2761_18935 [Acidimicrobiales bacterium]